MIRKESYKKKTKWDRCHRERERKRFLFQMLIFIQNGKKKTKKKKQLPYHLNFGTLSYFLLLIT